MKLTQFFVGFSFIFLSLSLASCGGESNEENPEDQANQENAGSPGGNANILKVGDKLFNLPSPLETAMLIEEVGGHFSADMLNPSIDPTKYSTKNAQAMNLGIYGADLGYSLIHNQSQNAFKLMATCKKISGELGISPSLYISAMKRFEGNMENRDSLLSMVSELNRLSDEYLKENESEDISALILYGGWIESLYFTTSLTKQLKDPRLRARVGEQKNSLENLIGLMAQVNTNGSMDDVVNELVDLKKSFEKVQYSYEWAAPETVAAKKLTIIKSKSNVTMDDAVLTEISDKVALIRNKIIGA